jgi:hypothetical protein
MSKIINNANAKKPFCKVCFDAKKPESEYTSHRVRSLPDMNGKTIVTCPVLAATECRYCYQFGHTTKFCTVLEENKKKAEKAKSAAIKEQRAAERAAAAPQQATAKADLKYAGKFAGLEEEDEPEVVEPVAVAVAIKQAEFPTLGQKKEVRFAAVSQSNWAAMAAKPAAPPKPAPVKMNTTVLPSRTWDLEESDSEDDEEMYPALPTKAVEKDEWDDLPIISSSALMDNRSYLIAHSRALAEDDEW